MNLNILHVKKVNILTQLQLEEALLHSSEKNWCIINEGSPLAIVMGISNAKEELLNLPLVKRDMIPVIKRFSGGGTVAVDENTLFVSFIFAKETLDFSYPHEIFQWSETLYKKIFSSNFSLIENDYTIENKKCGGNAQYLKRKRWLHHSSFLWDYHPQNMEYLKIPLKRAPLYRKQRTHPDFLCTLKEHFSSKENFVQNLKNELAKEFLLTKVSLEEVFDQIKEKESRQSTKILQL